MSVLDGFDTEDLPLVRQLTDDACYIIELSAAGDAAEIGNYVDNWAKDHRALVIVLAGMLVGAIQALGEVSSIEEPVVEFVAVAREKVGL